MKRLVWTVLLAMAFVCGCDDSCRPNCLYVAPTGSQSSWHYSFPLGISRTVEQQYEVWASCVNKDDKVWWKASSELEAWRRVCSEPYNVCTQSVEAINQKCREARK